MSVDEDKILSTLSLEEIEALAEKKRQMVQEAEEQHLLDQIAELDEKLALLEEKRQLYHGEKIKLARKLAKLRGEQFYGALDDYRAIVKSEAAKELFDTLHGAFSELASGRPSFNQGYIAYSHRNKFVDLHPRDTYFVLYFPKRVQIHEFLPEQVAEAFKYYQQPTHNYERVYVNLKNKDRFEELLEAIHQAVAERVEFRL